MSAKKERGRFQPPSFIPCVGVIIQSYFHFDLGVFFRMQALQ